MSYVSKFMIISRRTLFRIGNVSEKSCTENKNLFYVQNIFFPEYFTVYEIMCKNEVEPGRPQMKIWHMRIARWITKAKDTHLEYVTMTSFLLQKWVRQTSLNITFIIT